MAQNEQTTEEHSTLEQQSSRRLDHPAWCVVWSVVVVVTHTHTRARAHAHTRLTALCLGLSRSASTRKVKPIRILMKHETVSGSGISWAICKSRSRQMTTPAPYHSVFFAGRMPFLPPNQQCRCGEGTAVVVVKYTDIAVRSLTCHTATGTDMPYRITQC